MTFRAAGSGEAYKPPVRLPNTVKSREATQSDVAAPLFSAAPVVPRKRALRDDYFDDEEGDEEERPGLNAVSKLGNEATARLVENGSKELRQVGEGEGDEVDPLDGS